MKKVILLVGLNILLLNATHFAQDLVSGNFNKDTFTFDFSFENKNSEPIYITKIGATTQINFGEFSCPSKDGISEPISDFVLKFRPQNSTLLLDSYIGIKIESGDVRSFTYSVIPDISRACDDWAFEVTAMVRFNNGYTFWSASELLLSENYNSLGENSMLDQDIQNAIYHGSANEKLDALNSMQYSSLGQMVKERLCTTALTDKDANVRMATVTAIKDNSLTFLTDQLVANLFSAQDAREKIHLINVFGAMKDPSFIDPLIGVLINGELELAEAAANALIRIDRSDIKSKMSFMFKRDNSWSRGDDMQKEKFLLMARVIIHFEDDASASIIKDILSNPDVDIELRYELLSILSAKINNFQHNNAFLTKMNGAFDSYLQNRNSIVRHNALNVYLAASDFEKDQKKAIKKALKDDDYSVKCNAAVWAGELGFEEFKDDVQNLCNDASSPGYDEICQALIKLQGSE